MLRESARRLAPGIGAAILALGSTPGGAEAATVTLHESAVESIFMQPVFGGTPIDIRYGTVERIVAPDLLKITSHDEVRSAFSLRDAGLGVSMYFVDELRFCGTFSRELVGCAAIGGNDVILESGFTAGAAGDELIAHELLHNLGLFHLDPPPDNLMNPDIIDGNIALTSDQADRILASPFLQTEVATGVRFVEIDPYLIAPVPLPAGGALFAAALGALGVAGAARARRRAGASA